jgi:hypothetical protein
MRLEGHFQGSVSSSMLPRGVVIGWWNWNNNGNEQAKVIALDTCQVLVFEREKLHRHGISRPGIVNSLLMNVITQVNHVGGRLQSNLGNLEGVKQKPLLSL